MEDLKKYCQDVADKARDASYQMAAIRGELKNRWLLDCADRLMAQKATIFSANEQDLAQANANQLSPAMIDRLTLSEKTLTSMANALREIAAFPDPIGKIIDSTVRTDGLEIQKVRVPVGVVFFIYESRPNVTTDAAAICVKSGNAVILRGGKEAFHSNQILSQILAESAREVGLPENAIQLVQTTDRNAIDEFLHRPESINVAIPRGGQALIRRVTQEAQMPVIKHFAGNCHVYIDRYADPEVAEAVLINSKCQRLGTCNTAESLLVDEAVATTLLPRLIRALEANQVEIRGDEQTRALFPQVKTATEDDFYQEYLAAIISVKIVESVDQAIEHINTYGSHHTETIVSQEISHIKKFTSRVDSSAVMVNASTRLNDGGQFGLGAEIGISTDKFHARGPCGVNELTCYKYVVYGQGHLRQ